MAKYLGSYHNDVTIIPFRQLKKQLDIPGGIKLAQDILNQSEETESNNEPRHWALRVTFDDGGCNACRNQWDFTRSKRLLFK